MTRIEIDGTHNFRDVATTAPGILAGRLYRSDALSRLTDDGRAALAALGISRVIDLRATDEALASPDAIDGLGIEVVPLPIFDGASVVSAEMIDLPGVYRDLLTVWAHRVGDAIRAIADADGPVLVHCTAGKDRTGMVVALTLLAVGADHETVADDYSLTEVNLAGPWVERMLAHAAAHGVEATDAIVEIVSRSPRAALHATIDWLHAEHGSVDAYLDSIGVDASVRDRLTRFLSEP